MARYLLNVYLRFVEQFRKNHFFQVKVTLAVPKSEQETLLPLTDNFIKEEETDSKTGEFLIEKLTY